MDLQTDPREWKKQARDLFACSSGEYASGREQDQSFRAQLAIVRTMLAGERGRILDIGCATGSTVTAFRNDGFELVGVDFSPEMIAYASRRFGSDPKVQFSRADAELLPFRSESFDHVTCLGVFEYLPDYRQAISEIARVLRPGGLAILSIPSRISPYYISRDLAYTALGPAWKSLKRLAGVQPPPPSARIPPYRANRCIPWRLRSAFREKGLALEQSAFSHFLVFPFDPFWPAASLRIAAFLERFSSSRLLGWIGCQYLLASRKTKTAVLSP
jgi:SAM-dependent methyltransferase